MKKLFLTAIAGASFCLFAGSVAAQDGEVYFETFHPDDSGLTMHLAFDVDGSTRLAGSRFKAVAYLGSSSDFAMMNPLGSGPAEFLPAGSGGEGYVDGTTSNAGKLAATGFAAGSTAFYSIAAWDSNTGATFDSATVRGFSTPVQITVGGTVPGDPPQLISTTLNTFDSFQLQNVAMVPEPSTVALGIIGGLALLMRRRRS